MKCSHGISMNTPCAECADIERSADAQHISQAAALKEAVLKDAERYRWMRENDWDSPIVKLDYDDYRTLKGEALDAAIDEAMKSK